jgi:hypothetical protein
VIFHIIFAANIIALISQVAFADSMPAGNDPQACASVP